jgi:hypothetical protein
MNVMPVTRDVILDLLPLYFAGDVSADTKALVDEFLRTDPDFARMSQRFDALLKDRSPAAARDAGERRAFERTRLLLRYRNQMIGLAIGYSLLPFAFLFRHGQVYWIMMRDKPKVAIGFAIAALGCWLAVYFIDRRARREVNSGVGDVQ